MGLLLTWDNTALLANPNVLAQRALQRQKIIGGTFYTTGFTPANDLATSIVSTELTTYVVNKVYELKVQSICAAGISDNGNGIQEGIVFGCLNLEVVVVANPFDSFSGKIGLTGTDIEGVKYTLKLQSDSSIVEPEQDIPVSGGFSQIDYTGLIPSTDYYIDAVLYATINGEIVEFPCGGNISGFQFTTEPAP